MLIRRSVIIGFLSALLASPGIFAEDGQTTVITVPSVPVGGAVSLGGTVVPFKEATLAAQLPGRVESIAGEEGDSFEEGATLVTISDDELLAQRRAAFAMLSNAEASLRNAGVQYSRQWISPYGGQSNDMMGGMSSMMRGFTNPMQGFMGGSEPRVDRHAQLYQQGTAIEQARNQIVQARSRIEEIDTKLRDTRSIAPFDGVISKKLVDWLKSATRFSPGNRWSFLRTPASCRSRLMCPHGSCPV
jgi:multidrug efflux pump subunit AcrA (membrane-fusion protein)